MRRKCHIVLTANGGGAICDGNGACVPLTVSVARVGAGGTTSLTLAAAPVFIETRNVADGALVGTPIALPTAASGANQALTVGGLAVTDAQLSRTADGHALLIAGYAATPGSPNPVNNVAFARVVGYIDAAGAVDTSTVFPSAFIAGNIRSVVSADGATLWAAGGERRRNGRRREFRRHLDDPTRHDRRNADRGRPGPIVVHRERSALRSW